MILQVETSRTSSKACQQNFLDHKLFERHHREKNGRSNENAMKFHYSVLDFPTPSARLSCLPQFWLRCHFNDKITHKMICRNDAMSSACVGSALPLFSYIFSSVILISVFDQNLSQSLLLHCLLRHMTVPFIRKHLLLIRR